MHLIMLNYHRLAWPKMPGIVLTPSPERAYRYITDGNFRPSSIVLNGAVTMIKTREIFNRRWFYILKFSITSDDTSKINLKLLSQSNIAIEKNDLLCLIPFGHRTPEELLETIMITSTQFSSDTQPSFEHLSSSQRYSKEYMSKIKSSDKYFITLDPKIHSTLLNLFCEYKHSLQKKLIDGSTKGNPPLGELNHRLKNHNGIPLYNFYFGDTSMLSCKTFIKVINCWFVEF